MPGMSWTREMRPVPIAPTMIWLPGALPPRTLAGTIVGNPGDMVPSRKGQRPCLGLGPEHELGGQEAVGLAHRGLGPVEDVVDDLPAVGQLDVARVDVARVLPVRQEQV